MSLQQHRLSPLLPGRRRKTFLNYQERQKATFPNNCLDGGGQRCRWGPERFTWGSEGTAGVMLRSGAGAASHLLNSFGGFSRENGRAETSFDIFTACVIKN